MTKLWEEVRTRDYEMRKPVPFASVEISLMREFFYLERIHPIAL
jgi:hypothetical protein